MNLTFITILINRMVIGVDILAYLNF